MKEIAIETLVITPFVQNCRIVTDLETRKAAVIDPGGEIPRILEALAQSGAEVESIFLTHAHIDHAGGVAELRETLAKQQRFPKLYGHEADKPARQLLSMQANMFGLSPDEYRDCPEPDVYVAEGETFFVGSIGSEVRFVPGHCPGHVVLFFEKLKVAEGGDVGVHNYTAPLCIAGDTLFSGSIGRTDLPGGDHETLLSMIREKLFTLPEETVVACGHGPNTTIGREKKSNPFFVNLRG